MYRSTIHKECIVCPLQQWLRERAMMLRYTTLFIVVYNTVTPVLFVTHNYVCCCVISHDTRMKTEYDLKVN
jgi:PhoPQ-activated pathogenicity-related protein